MDEVYKLFPSFSSQVDSFELLMQLILSKRQMSLGMII